jgi:glycosyltransferase involved in cell wall biosynthesis
VLNAYAVHPVDNGGGNRIHWLYRSLARHADVDLVTLGPAARGSDVLHPAPGLRELRVARTEAHERADMALREEAHAPVYDIAALANIALTPDYRAVLENSLAGSSLAIAAHPYMVTALRETGYSGALVHESQNREHLLKSRMLPASPINDRLLGLVAEAERYSCRESRLVYACCEEDAAGLLEEYGGNPADMVVIPNGTDTERIRFMDAAERKRVRSRLGMDSRPLALFLASGHRPNIEAAEHIFRAAEKMPGVVFAFVGNIDGAFHSRALPGNVWMAGFVSDEERNVWLQAADVALNPMLYGGGTNLKLLDYFAAGLPVVSTPIGLRGTGALHQEHALEAPIESLGEAVANAIGGGSAIEAMTRRARALVEANFDWGVLGARLHGEITKRGLL